MNPISDRVNNANGAAIRVEESGAGEPALVFLHYWDGSSRTWHSIVDRLAGTSRCIILDQRGWGASIATDGRYDLSAMADDVEAVARQLGLGRYAPVKVWFTRFERMIVQCRVPALSGRWALVQPVGSVAPSIDNAALGENTKRTDSANDGGLVTSIKGDAQRQ